MSSLVSAIKDFRKKSPLAFFITVHTVIFLLVFTVLGQLSYSPGALELSFARQILSGEIPYRDFTSEYPPLALLSFVLPALVSRRDLVYGLAFAVEMLLLDFLILKLLAVLDRCLKIPHERTLTVYTLFVFAVGPIIISRYDILPAALTLAAIASFVTNLNALAFALVALGVTAKVYPIIIAPLMVIYLLRDLNMKKLIWGSISFITTLLVLNLPFYLASPENFIGFLTYHAERGLHSESTYASWLLISKLLGLTDVTGVFSYGSWNLASPLADKLAKLSFPFSAILLFVLYAVYAWKLWKSPRNNLMSSENARDFVRFSTLSVAIFIASSKVFSVQYLIWLMPLIPLTEAKQTTVMWFIFAVIGIMTQFIYPYNYLNFESFLTPYVLVIIFRNILFVALTILIATSGRDVNKRLQSLASSDSRL